MQTEEWTWRSYHIFYYDVNRHDFAILQGVAPLVDRLYDGGLIDGFFFIRYHDMGPHVRLRLRCPGARAAASAEEITLDFWRDFLLEHPSQDIELPYRRTRPNNSVHSIRYEPEVGRYGGPGGVAIAERHFEDSSRIAIDVLRSVSSSSARRERTLLAATQLVAMVALSGGFRGERLSAFFRDHLTHKRMHSPASGGLPDAASEALERRFRLLDAMYAGPASEATETNPVGWWKVSLDRTCELLRSYLEGHPEYDQENPSLACNRKYGLILQSYIHMLLNRVGFWGRSEHAILRLVRDAAVAAEPVRQL